MSVGLALLMVLGYIWFRFEWQFGLGAVLALAHDVILTIGVFSLTQIEFNLTIIAAILTIVGYSLNDTVIVYDRIRENLRKFKKMPLPDVLNISINDTLSRTILTSMTTLLALVALYVLGGSALKGFSFAMIWGVFVGTYSSIFVASPLLLALKLKRGVNTGGKLLSGHALGCLRGPLPQEPQLMCFEERHLPKSRRALKPMRHALQSYHIQGGRLRRQNPDVWPGL